MVVLGGEHALRSFLCLRTAVFGLLDVDQGGTIDATELGRAFKILEVEIPRYQQKRVISAMLAFLDKDDDGKDCTRYL